jgi:hypothetical protein
MEFLVGVYDLYAFTAISRRWLFWMMAAGIPLGFLATVAELARYISS